MPIKKFSWGVLVCIGLWAIGLVTMLWFQRLVYANTGPFFDSLSYYGTLARFMLRQKDGGFWQALTSAFVGSNVAMPWIEAAFIGLFTTKPALWMGPIIQAPWVLVFLLSLYAFFRKVFHQSRLVSVLTAIFFVANAGTFYFNRGWSDFSMDLMAYMVLGNALVFYFWTYHTEKKWPWTLAGIFFGLSCLWRATSPVYIVLMLAPLESWRLWQAPDKKSYLLRFLNLLVPSIVLAGPFLIFNAPYLYGYYVLNSPDVHAKLPFRKALWHLYYLWNGKIGSVLLRLGAAWFIVRWVQAWLIDGAPLWKKFNWPYLWCAVVPVGFLIVSGAGLNPYVCFPSVFGLLLVMFYPFANPPRLSRMLMVVMTILSLIAVVRVVRVGYKVHRKGIEQSRRLVINASLDALVEDARRRNLTHIKWAVAHEGYWNDAVPGHILIYERGGELQPDQTILYQGMYFQYVPTLTPELLQSLNAGKDADAQSATSKLDYIYLIDESVLASAHVMFDHDTPAMTGLEKFLKASASVRKTPIGPDFVLSDFEHYRLYRIEH